MMRCFKSFCLAAACCLATAEIYELSQVPLPDARSVVTLYVFYAHVQDGDQATVRLQNLTTQDADMHGIRLALWPLVDVMHGEPGKICLDTKDMLGEEEARKELVLLVHTASGQSAVYSPEVRPVANTAIPKQAKYVFKESGAYVLMLANCGDIQGGSVTGNIIFESSQGLLPGSEKLKLSFYRCQLVIYALLAVCWTSLCFLRRRTLGYIQYFIVVVVVLGLIESIAWQQLLDDWNTRGIRKGNMFLLATLASTVKTSTAFVFTLYISLGSDVVDTELRGLTVANAQLISLLYSSTRYLSDIVLSFRLSYMLNGSLVLACTLPSTFVTSVLLCWSFLGLGRLATTATLPSEKQALYLQLRRTLAVTSVFDIPTVLMQLADLDGSKTFSHWRYVWVLYDGVPVLVFSFALLIVMCIATPPSNETYKYSVVQTADAPNVIGSCVVEL